MSPKSKTGKDIKDQMTALERARKQNVAKRNDMIQKSKKSLSIVENKAVSYIFSKVKPDDDPDTIYTFDCQEFYRLLRWKKESYTDLRAMLYSIASQTFGIIDEETGTEKIVHWFNTIHLKMSKSGKIVSDSKLPGRFVEIKIHEDLMEYVFGLEQQRRENHMGQEVKTIFRCGSASMNRKWKHRRRHLQREKVEENGERRMEPRSSCRSYPLPGVPSTFLRETY